MAFVYDLDAAKRRMVRLCRSSVNAAEEACNEASRAFFSAQGEPRAFASNVKALAKIMKEAEGDAWTKGPASNVSRAKRVIAKHERGLQIAQAWFRGNYSKYPLHAMLAEIAKPEESAYSTEDYVDELEKFFVLRGITPALIDRATERANVVLDKIEEHQAAVAQTLSEMGMGGEFAASEQNDAEET